MWRLFFHIFTPPVKFNANSGVCWLTIHSITLHLTTFGHYRSSNASKIPSFSLRGFDVIEPFFSDLTLLYCYFRMLLQFLNDDYFFFSVFLFCFLFFIPSDEWWGKEYAILACTHIFHLFFTTKVSTWQVSVLFIPVTRENAIDQPHFINVFLFSVIIKP